MSAFESYFPGKPGFTEKQLPNLNGKVYMITGGTGGIGFELAKMLYHANASRIYVLSRSVATGEDAIKEITASSPNPTVPARTSSAKDAVHFLPIDLSDLATVKTAAHAFLARESRLDVLWHNAAIMLAPEGSKSVQGHELTFATNLLGPFLLQHFLTPIMLATASNSPPATVRVCWAGSGPAVHPPGTDGIVWEDLALERNSGFGARAARYMQSKAGNVMLAAEMQQRYGRTSAANRDGIVSCAFNPGAIRSNLAKHAPRLVAWIHNAMASSARDGALVELFAGFAPEVVTACEQQGLCFVVPAGKIGKTIEKVEEGIRNRGSGKRLWELCDGLVKEYYTITD
ncbi:NAD(P)-binding protein [Thozetella sp. PMI_491]|nr:NAD(P)-binding protein [Thozetella sp. PMI_491]